MANRSERLEQWWSGLSGQEQQHARDVVLANQPDAWFLRALRELDINVVTVFVNRSGRVHIPNDVTNFVEAHEVRNTVGAAR